MRVARCAVVGVLTRRRLAHGAVIIATVATCVTVSVWTTAQAGSPGSEPLRFDIPSQPLMSALESYGITSGREVLYNAKFATGRVSNELKGVFTPESALQILLSGTDLTARYTARDAFVVVPVVQDNLNKQIRRSNSDAFSSGEFRFAGYYGLVQERIKNAFCANPVIRPGAYRIALRFWIGPSGTVLRSKLMGTTGQYDRDLAISDAMRHLVIDEAPPAGLKQPFTMVILPRPSKMTKDCVSTDAHVRASN
jgi:hypothetical protein